MKISVITVAYNAAETIADTLDSVAAQTGAEFEHIVIDGQSTDDTLAIIKSRQHDRMKCVSEPDDGIYNAMNKGIQRATGDVFGFLNADDLYADNTVLQQISSAFEDSSVEACYADMLCVSQNNQSVIRYWKSREFRKGLFALGWCPAHPTFYVRRAVAEKLGGFDESFRLAADGDFMMRYLEVAEINCRYVPRTWTRMRLGGQTGQAGNIIPQNKELLAALRKNNIPFTAFGFIGKKLYDRVHQVVAARLTSGKSS